MKYVLMLILFLILTTKTFAECEFQTFYANALFNPNLIQIENTAKALLKTNPDNTAYTRVPRGLIISIAESEFFNKNDYHIKESGYYILDAIIAILDKFGNRCIVESHTDEKFSAESSYHEDWEMSIMRANEITSYIVRQGKINRNRIFPLGFGEIMPFKENVSRKGFKDCRVDFVIIDYEYKR